MPAPCIHVIAPAALASDLEQAAAELGLDLQTTLLSPAEAPDAAALHGRLQQAIDIASTGGSTSQIVLLFGSAQQATLDLRARHVPLTLPRLHADLAAFLAADSEPHSADRTESTPAAPTQLTAPDTADAPALAAFLQDWEHFYQRTAYLHADTPEQREHARIAAELAVKYGWQRTTTATCHPQLRKLITALRSDHDVLCVPPHHVTRLHPDHPGLQAVPVWRLDPNDAAAQDQVIEVGLAEATTDGTTQVSGGSSGGDSGGSSGGARLGLGIDAGGTYTDVVLYDFASDRVVQKAKALTTKWDYTIGIAAALDQLDAARLRQVDLVSVSTTLATNAVVEGRGQKVALLIMPPYGLFAPSDIPHRPIAIVQGQLEIDGTVRAPVNPEEIRRLARQMVEREQVGAFAVTGYASHVNPEHEMEIRRILETETGLPVTCGHDVSEGLDYRIRAQTAALNGRIIPILIAFLREASDCLHARGITAPLMIVRSDGSLMSMDTARQRPIETILSGPAASVAGARHLTQAPNAIVIDIGGTTTDTALIRNGVVRTAKHGANVGGRQTHVQALDMRTCGLGGDSLIASIDGKLRIGPRRVHPIAWLGAQHVDLEPCFQWIEAHLERYAVLPELMDLYLLNPHARTSALSPHEQRIAAALSQRPYTGHELSKAVLEHWWENLDLERLDGQHLVLRCGLTPTDLLHAAGQFTRWDTAAATRLLKLMSQALDTTPERLIEQVQTHFVHRLALEALKKQLDEQTPADALETTAIGRTLLDNWLHGRTTGYQVRIALDQPLIGIGAPVAHYLPAAAQLLQTQALIPEHADVANALGAITSSVVIRRQVEICPDMLGRYGVYGMPQAPTFGELHQARAAAMAYLRDYVSGAAQAAGTRHGRLQFVVHDKVAPLADGGQVFIAQSIEARLTGRPELTPPGK